MNQMASSNGQAWGTRLGVTSVTVLVAWCFYRVLWHERRSRTHNEDGDAER